MYKCNICNKEFISTKALGGHQRAHSSKTPLGGDILKSILRAKLKRERNISNYEKSPLICKNCNTSIPYDLAISRKSNRNYKEYKNIFCTQSCAATYNNKHKTHGTRKSKIEYFIEKNLKVAFPSLKMLFNDRTENGSDLELDIYIPSLKLAFEINGIYHYKPIYGEKAFKCTVTNDFKKTEFCKNNNIELYVLDISRMTGFKDELGIPYFELIKQHINEKVQEYKIDLSVLPVIEYIEIAQKELTKECVTCNNIFNIPYKRYGKKFCSDDCWRQHERNNSTLVNFFISKRDLIIECIEKKYSKSRTGKVLGFKDLGGYDRFLKFAMEDMGIPIPNNWKRKKDAL